MIFFYGWKTKRIGVAPITDHSCTHCDAHHSLFIETFRSYIHFFWIPLIPLGKSSGSFCGHCKCALRKREMPPDLRDTARVIASNTKTPWYFFALPIAVVTLFISLFSISLIAHS